MPSALPSDEVARPPMVLASSMAPHWTLLLTFPALLGFALLRPKRRVDPLVASRRR